MTSRLSSVVAAWVCALSLVALSITFLVTSDNNDPGVCGPLITVNVSVPTVTGAPGATGIPGATGATGAPGVNGSTGTPGATGKPGATGTPGATAVPGATGAPGVQGETGSTGAPGSVGPQGPTGPAGAQGAAGADGTCVTVTGAPGLTGAPGATGATGAPGVQGEVGPEGPAVNLTFGAFHSRVSQQLSARYTPVPLFTTNTDSSDGISMVSVSANACDVAPYCSNIKVNKASTFNIAFSAQLAKSGNQAFISSDIWLARKRNGTWENLSWTATRVYVPNDTDYSVAAWNWMVTAQETDEYRIMWSSIDANWASLRVFAGDLTGYPSVPSQIPGVIITVNQVD